MILRNPYGINVFLNIYRVMKKYNIFNKQKEKIKMVNEKDLLKYLSSIGILKDIQDGKLHCRFCGKIVTFKNLQVLFPCDNKICIICSRIKCLEKL